MAEGKHRHEPGQRSGVGVKKPPVLRGWWLRLKIDSD